MAYIRYRDVPYQRSTLVSNDRLDYMENGIIAAESGEVEVSIEDVDGLEAALNDLEQRLAALEPGPEPEQ